MTTSNYLRSAANLGQWARNTRKAQGLTLVALSDRAGLGVRFLSEFERGKETAELGKALAALDALGLKLVPAMDNGATAAVGGEIVVEPPGPPPPVRTPDPLTAPRDASSPDPGPRPAAGGDAARLWDMLLAAGDIQAVLRACSDEAGFLESTALKRAVERCFDVIGEAARRVTPGTQARLSRIAWRTLIARRNGLVMGYENVDQGALFRAARAELPALIQELRAAMSRGSPD